MNKKVIFVLGIIAGFVFTFLNGFIFENKNVKLKDSIYAINSEVVKINEVVPFNWDTVYYIEPYTSKEEIQDIIGIENVKITDNNISEGFVYLVFVKGNSVVTVLKGYPDNIGYDIRFKDKVNYSDDVSFNVIKDKNIIVLEKAQ